MLELIDGMPTQCLEIHVDVRKLFWIVETFQHVYYILKKSFTFLRNIQSFHITMNHYDSNVFIFIIVYIFLRYVKL